MQEIVLKIRYSKRGLSKRKNSENQKDYLISDELPDLQSWSKFFESLQCFSRGPINHK